MIDLWVNQYERKWSLGSVSAINRVRIVNWLFPHIIAQDPGLKLKFVFDSNLWTLNWFMRGSLALNESFFFDLSDLKISRCIECNSNFCRNELLYIYIYTHTIYYGYYDYGLLVFLSKYYWISTHAVRQWLAPITSHKSLSQAFHEYLHTIENVPLFRNFVEYLVSMYKYRSKLEYINLF